MISIENLKNDIKIDILGQNTSIILNLSNKIFLGPNFPRTLERNLNLSSIDNNNISSLSNSI